MEAVRLVRGSIRARLRDWAAMKFKVGDKVIINEDVTACVALSIVYVVVAFIVVAFLTYLSN